MSVPDEPQAQGQPRGPKHRDKNLSLADLTGLRIDHNQTVGHR
jgi:hypothetical protein